MGTALPSTSEGEPAARLEPAVDVGIVTWNTGDLTARAVRTLLDTEQGCRLRVLIRDNASTDGTPLIVAEKVPEAEVDAGAENLGFAGGVNTLLARSTAPWFFLLNPDAWPEPGAIRTLVDTAIGRPSAAAVVPRIENPDGSYQHTTHPFPSVRVAAMAAVGPRIVGRRRAQRYLLNGAWFGDEPRTVDWAIAAAWLMRRDAIAEIGGLDESFFMYAEDLEWCWRARKLGWEIAFEPGAVVRHVFNVSGEKAWGSDRTKIHVRNALRFYRREHSLLSSVAWWAMGLGSAAARYLRLRLHRDPRAATWKIHVIAHLRAWRADR